MPARSFNKLVIAVSGTFPGYKQADLKKIVESQGATFSSSVGADCTHLITTQKEVEKNGTKFQQACGIQKCEIVILDWLLASEKANKPVSEKSYHFGTHNPDNKSQTDSAPAKSYKKRSAKDALDADEDDSSKKLKNGVEDAQRVTKEKAGKLKVEVDEGYYPNGAGWAGPAVHIDKSGLIWDATLNQTVAAANNNKFYRLQLLVSQDGTKYQTWTRWGRVGENGQSAHLGDGTLDSAQKFFEKKFKDKSGLAWKDRLKDPKANKYTFIERNYEESEDEGEADTKPGKEASKTVQSKLPKAVQNLVSFIFNQEYFLSTMAQMSYDAKKLPLGKLSKRTLQTGFATLKELAELAATPTLATSRYGMQFQAAMEQLSNRYFTTIPHVFGRNRPPVLNDQAYIKKEVELLETLTDMEVANSILKDASKAEDVNPIDRQFEGLGMQEMAPLDHKSTEFTELENYLTQSRGATHHLRYKVLDIFRIERKGEHDRFTSSSFSSLKNSNRRLLWHGSRSTNYGGILSQGLRIAPPEAPVSGYMFGKGVYFADMSSKSANYCCSYNSGGKGLLLLGDVELGDPLYELYHSDYHAGENAKKAGSYSTLGKGQTIPGGWKDAGCVQSDLQGIKMPDVSAGPAQLNNNQAGLMYNEYIVYDVSQIRLRYLFFVDMR
ncbi:poly polymerase catalytic domain-containing protein [Aspergillus pseudoustus]|uniref:Poly [ADP-ribose] polymerase n=1 Tax=Aspergillus pseudoustus TaxID=1810923 RepID=A0ABR4KUR4_9EURO